MIIESVQWTDQQLNGIRIQYNTLSLNIYITSVGFIIIFHINRLMLVGFLTPTNTDHTYSTGPFEIYFAF